MTAAIITVSDTRTAETDVSGDALSDLLREFGGEVVERRIVPDERSEIVAVLTELCSRKDILLILTTGGTGISPRDCTPEATRDVIEVEIPGIAEAMRQQTAYKAKTAMLSRGVAGVSSRTLIINLPGSPKAVRECFEVIGPVLQHAIAQMRGIADHEKSNPGT